MLCPLLPSSIQTPLGTQQTQCQLLNAHGVVVPLSEGETDAQSKGAFPKAPAFWNARLCRGWKGNFWRFQGQVQPPMSFVEASVVALNDSIVQRGCL